MNDPVCHTRPTACGSASRTLTEGTHKGCPYTRPPSVAPPHRVPNRQLWIPAFVGMTGWLSP